MRFGAVYSRLVGAPYTVDILLMLKGSVFNNNERLNNPVMAKIEMTSHDLWDKNKPITQTSLSK